jgi:type II secretory pathway component PulF
MDWQFSYRYTGTDSLGRKIEGFARASNQVTAIAKLKRLGVRVRSIRFSPGETVRALMGSEFDLLELARFYETVAARIKFNSGSLIETVKATVDTISDSRLRDAVILLQRRMESGADVSEAMISAGFPNQHAMLVNANVQQGSPEQAFARLATVIKRRRMVGGNISKTLIQPKLMLALIWFGGWAFLTFLMPSTKKLITELKAKVTALHEAVFSLSDLLAPHPILGFIFVSAVAVGFMVLLKSDFMRRLVERWPLWKKIVERSDMSNLWSAFALMIAASQSPSAAANMAKTAASRPESMVLFGKLAVLLRGGESVSRATERAGFPQYIVYGIRQAEARGDLVEGIEVFCSNLDQDVEVMVQVLNLKIQNYAMFYLMPAIVALAFFLLLFPRLSTTLSNA